MESEKIFHNWLITYLNEKLSRDYSEISVNLEGEKKNDFNGHYPNLILKNHGFVVGIVKVETEGTISRDRAKEWKKLSQCGAKLMLMAPERSKGKVTSLLWDEGFAHDVAIGSYELKISMP